MSLAADWFGKATRRANLGFPDFRPPITTSRLVHDHDWPIMVG